ncbi:aspartate--tRNA(Asn) ligase [Lapillicoccus jejuensis]|uniref:Aspartate--tRNA(Asp/Asn) ligase n=1 Tax=Lapillicoccus jejuensis TaxID=402171 RepID=A0A542E307_9MICO|nr:aspartate--tRNA(Asn) ligase [Lapillicoccus jejuensis]TQJ09715.1 aspartyl-tRNA synthetase [Lapillicoccus jejuensis]
MSPSTLSTSSTLARTLAADLSTAPPGARVTLQGWLHRRRDLARVTFLVVRDRSGLAQVVVAAGGAELPPGCSEEAALEVSGTVAANPAAPGGVEVVDPTVTVLGEPAGPPSVELWRPQPTASLPVLLDRAPVAWRHPRQKALWQLSAAALAGFRSTLDHSGFTEIQTPKVVGQVTESGANVFRLDWFGEPAFLAQSPQLYKQQLVGVFERVYETGPVFRAEPHDTVRHLAEYVSLDVELGFVRDHRDVLAVLRDAVAGMLESVRRSPAAQLLGVDVPVMPDEVPVIHFADALALVGAPEDEPDLAPAHERALGAWAREVHGSDFVAVEGYPMTKRPFYTHPQPDDPRWSNSFDLLFRGLELVTGGQRLHRHEDYVAAIEARGETPEAYADYLQAFAAGMPPHGGFAIGLERFTARLAQVDNVREVTLFPRDLHRLRP